MRIQLLTIAGSLDGARVEARIRRVLRKLDIGNPLTDKGRVSGLIVVGDGTPDDVVVTLVAHTLDGEECTAGLLVSTRKGVGSVETVIDVVRIFPNRPIALVIDQDREDLERLYEKIAGKFRKFGVRLEIKDGEGRRREYAAGFHSNGKLIIVVNGLGDYVSHKIEDHLLILKGLTPKRLRSEGFPEDPKEAWKKLSSQNKDLLVDVLRELKEVKDLERYFPQHIALRRICHQKTVR